jgi:hypothetical protein
MLKLSSVSIWIVLLISCSQRDEQNGEQEFMAQFINSHIKYDELNYAKDTVKGISPNLVEIVKRKNIDCIGCQEHIFLSETESEKISSQTGYKSFDYWKETLFSDSLSLKLEDRSIKLVEFSKDDRQWLFTQPVFIRNNEYCFFSYQHGNLGNYSAYKT